MEIIRAKHSGFCFGVKKAVDITYKTLDDVKESGRRVFTCGELIHNRDFTRNLQADGVSSLNDITEAKEGDIVIVRSHGEGENFFNDAVKAGVEVIDATCPFVKKIHSLVEKYALEGKDILIIGDKDHPEVKGINGWCLGKAEIISAPGDIDAIDVKEYYAVCQSTVTEDFAQKILDLLKKKGCKVHFNKTICSATKVRQDSCIELSKNVDCMVVIGGRNSSNTKKLYELAKKNAKKSYFIENISNLALKEITKYNRIGITAGASTPESVIKEVITGMNEANTNENLSMADFMDEIDASLRLPKAGEVVEGKVHQVTEKEVIVNLGCKKDGILPIDEVLLKEGETMETLFHEGDDIKAKVVKTDDGDGGILLSKKRLEVSEHWDEISLAMENKEKISVKVARAVKGGVIAVYKGVSGFIPLSQLSDKYVETADEFINKELDVKVIRVEQRRNRAVFSHKAVINEEKKKQIAEIWKTISVNDIVEGTVMRFTDYGAFVDIGGIDGLLHISEISWGKLKHPSEVLEIGQKINVKILAMNEEKGKISLGLKQTTPEPWSVIENNYYVGEEIEGKVVQIKEYGAFIELEPGLDGLVHISEVAHKRVTNIEDELKIGQKVKARVLDIDIERRRISLSIKDTLEYEPLEKETEKESKEETKEAEAKEEIVEVKPEEKTDEAKEAETVDETAEETACAVPQEEASDKVEEKEVSEEEETASDEKEEAVSEDEATEETSKEETESE